MLIVVRHGRTPANAAGQLLGRRDPELDELGRAQAAAVGIAIPTAAFSITAISIAFALGFTASLITLSQLELRSPITFHPGWLLLLLRLD